ncbi:T9SS type A sorting domain-containing protein [bacterium]|nr:T9SS type A sorting domain-containing protein [bacterium]
MDKKKHCFRLMFLVLTVGAIFLLTYNMTIAGKNENMKITNAMSLKDDSIVELRTDPVPDGFRRALTSPMDWPDEYNIYRSDTYFEDISSATLIGTVPFGETRYDDEDVDTAEYYYYRATAMYGDVESEPTALDSGFASSPPPTVVNPPQGTYATDNIYGSIEVYWAPPLTLAGDVISYDDGLPDGSLGYGSAGNGLAMRFTSPVGGCTLLGLRFLFTTISHGLDFEVHVWGDGPGADLISPVDATILAPTPYSVWVDVATPSVFIDGDFYGGWIELDVGTPYVGADTNDCDERAWAYSGGTWEQLVDYPSFANYDLMIRAVVATTSREIIELSPTPVYSNSNKLGHNSIVPIEKSGPSAYCSSRPEFAFYRAVTSTSPMALLNYNIYRSTDPFTEVADAELVATVSAESLHYSDVSAELETDYLYGVTALYDEGESDLSTLDSGFATSMAPAAQILVYDYDGGDLLGDEGTEDEADVLINILEEIGYTDVYRSFEDEDLSRFNLHNYEAIFIVTGTYPNPPHIADADLESLIVYLESGGNVYFEGVDLGWDYLEEGSAACSAFFDMFHINWDGDGSAAEDGNVEYVEGNDVYFGVDITMDYDYQMTADHYVDEISTAGAGLVLTDQDGTGRGSRYHSTTYDFTAIYSAVYLGGMHDDVSPNLRSTILATYCEDMIGPPTARYFVPPIEDFGVGLNPMYKVASPETLDYYPPTNFAASEGMFNKIRLTWNVPAFIPPEGDSIELKWDDGIIDTIVSGTGSFSYLYASNDPGDGLVVSFMPPDPTDILVGLRFYPGSGTPFNVCVWGDDGGEPGDYIMHPFPVTPDVAGEWFDVRIPNIDVGDVGTFYAGMRNISTGVSVGCDNTSPDPYSWVILADTFYNMSDFAAPFDEIDLMIRAIVVNTAGIVREIKPTPASYYLGANYPNPFNAKTSIAFGVPNRTKVDVSIYNILGDKVETLHQGMTEAGVYQVDWKSSNQPSGIYFCKLATPNHSQTRKLLLMK